ncbi:MAG: RsmG family class I SAM-dependent methyltransferase, partial [Bacteroidota bacterium]
FHLVDSIGKKLKVIEAVKETLQLKNITTQHCRAEEIKNRKFDFAVSRAVAPLKDLLYWSKPLLKGSSYKLQNSNGEQTILKSGLICLKGGDLKNEIAESGSRPKKIELSTLFDEPFFKEKFLLHTSV